MMFQSDADDSLWSDLGFQDLHDDEAFVVWMYRCWQVEQTTDVLAEHRLAALLRHNRLHALLEDLFSLFQAAGLDGAMSRRMQGYPLLTCREEWLLGVLAASQASEADSTGAQQHPVAVATLAAICHTGLRQHGVRLRPPATIPRLGRDRLELQIARFMGGHW